MHDRLQYCLTTAGQLLASYVSDYYSDGPVADRTEFESFISDFLLPEINILLSRDRDPGDYYDNKRKLADHLQNLLKDERTPKDWKTCLERDLDLARYVGD